KIVIDARTARRGGLGTGLMLDLLRITSKLHLREPIARGLPGLLGIERAAVAQLDRAERDAPLLGADAILDNPCYFAATTKPDAGARQVFVENDVIGLAGWEREPGNGLGVEFHETR